MLSFLVFLTTLLDADGGAAGSATAEGAGEATGAEASGASGGEAGAGGDASGEESGAQKTSLGWLGAVAEQYRDGVKEFKGPSDLAKAFLESKTKLDGAIVKPGDGASDEERVAFLTALGVPANKDGYALTKPDLPKGLNYSNDFESWFRDTSHELNLSKAQAERLFEQYNKRVIEQYNAAQEARAQRRTRVLEQLQKEYGDKTDEVIAVGKRAIRVLGDEEFDRFLDETGLIDDPRMIRFSAELGKRISGDSLLKGGGGGNQSTNPDDPDSWNLPNSFPDN